MTELTHTTDADLIEHDDHQHGDADHHGPTDQYFIGMFFFLAALTAIEVAVSYIDIGPLFLPVLLGLMLIKFFSVVMVFMHVKYDHKLFGRLFFIGLGLATFVYMLALITFRFFEG